MKGPASNAPTMSGGGAEARIEDQNTMGTLLWSRNRMPDYRANMLDVMSLAGRKNAGQEQLG